MPLCRFATQFFQRLNTSLLLLYIQIALWERRMGSTNSTTASSDLATEQPEVTAENVKIMCALQDENGHLKDFTMQINGCDVRTVDDLVKAAISTLRYGGNPTRLYQSKKKVECRKRPKCRCHIFRTTSIRHGSHLTKILTLLSVHIHPSNAARLENLRQYLSFFVTVAFRMSLVFFASFWQAKVAFGDCGPSTNFRIVIFTNSTKSLGLICSGILAVCRTYTLHLIDASTRGKCGRTTTWFSRKRDVEGSLNVRITPSWHT